ncbi:MAG TPA: DUF3052 domain-containing protein [Candidatus Angelobacter sp.]|nr:DUF3052 domain-containing protein [Candidatus Angelobacter sp.]
MAGYSKRSLVEKLGIKSGQKIYIGNAPRNYDETLGTLPEKVVRAKALQGACDFIQFFSKDKSELESIFSRLKKNLAVNGALWISWPKGASGIKTDLNENMVREIGLKNGLVDVKVCAVDDVWSGLKFVFRLKDRG